MAHCGKSSVSIFQEIFASADKFSIPRGELSNELFYEILRVSKVLSRLATREAPYIYQLITNNLRFTCGKRKICSIIRKSQNNMNTIVGHCMSCIVKKCTV